MPCARRPRAHANPRREPCEDVRAGACGVPLPPKWTASGGFRLAAAASLSALGSGVRRAARGARRTAP
eukprot:2640566-Prymnesium_polylepis.1